MANVQESLSDISSQKSVTDWLMHVISGNMPGDGEGPQLCQEETRPDAASPTMNGAQRLAGELASHNGAGPAKAANGMVPNGVAANGVALNGAVNGVVPNGVFHEAKVSEFTADDLCGPPAFGPVTVKEEVKAEDLCWVPAPQPSEQGEPSNWTVNAAIAAEAAHVETAQDNVIPMPDVERDAPPVYRAEERVEDWEPRKYVISTADILRERAPSLVPQSSNGAAGGAGRLEALPEVMAGSSAPALGAAELPMAAAPEREVTLADLLREPAAVEHPVVAAQPEVAAAAGAVAPEMVAEPQVVTEAVAPEMIVEPQVVAPVEVVAPAAAVVETPVELTASPVPVAESRAVVIPMEARAEQAHAAEQVQSAAAAAVPAAEPMRVVEAPAPTPVGHPVGEIVSSEAKKEPMPPSTALVSEAKTNVVAMGAEQGENRPRGKRIPRAKREQVVTIADICRDWVLEEMLEKAGGSGEVDEDEDLADELEELIAENSTPPESVFAHEGIWGNAGGPRPDGVGPGEEPGEGAPSEQPEQTAGLVAAEGLTAVEGRAGVQSSGVKALLKLGSMLPWLARDFPVVESANKPQNNALTQEVRDEVAGMRLVQHEIRSTVHDHSLQLKRVEEQLSRVRETLVEEASETADLVDSVKSTNKAVAMFGVGVCVLLLVMLAMLVMLVMHGR